jgi:hypothetical protein
MGLKESKHFDFFLKSPLIIFVTIHKSQNISHHQLDYCNSERNALTHNKINPKKLNKEKRKI